jgi:hypothetical protein
MMRVQIQAAMTAGSVGRVAILRRFLRAASFKKLAIADLMKQSIGMELLLDVPEEVLEAVQTPGSDPAEAVLRELVLALLQRGAFRQGDRGKFSA